MTLVLRRSLLGPGTHALVIGAGVHEGQYVTDRQRMIEHAARQMVVWLATRYRNPTAELATIDVYLNSWIFADLDHVPNFTDQFTSRAVHQQIEAAAQTWMRRADSHEENVAIFYFAGRVFDRRSDTLLTFEDYERPYFLPATSNSGVASFLSIPAAMRGCRARRQLYLLDVDRCEGREEMQVEPLLRPRPELSPPPHQAVIYSATSGQRAFHESETGNFHCFVQSLADVLDTTDPDPSMGAISAEQLAAGLAEQISEIAAERGVDQGVEFETTSDFDFHYPLRPQPGIGLKAMRNTPTPPPPVRAESEQEVPSTQTGERRPIVRKHVDAGAASRPRLLAWVAQHRDSLAIQLVAATIGGLAVIAIAAMVRKLL